MEIFRSGLQSVMGGSSSQGGSATSRAAAAAETVERLVERLRDSTLLEDRRDACRALRAMSWELQVEVGAQALDSLAGILEHDRDDEEIVGYALDALANVCNGDDEAAGCTFADRDDAGGKRVGAAGSAGRGSGGGSGSLGIQFTEIFLKDPKNVQLVVDVLEDYDFRVRRPAVKLLTCILMNKPKETQEAVLASHMGVSRLMDVLVDSREVIRNDALLLLIQLTKGNANLQKIVAFENAFDKLADIIEVEGHSDGGIVVEDCLRLMLNLLRNNVSNQTFFREGSYIQRVTPFFELELDQQEIEVGWSAQKVSNMIHMLQVIRTLVAPSNPKQVISSSQKTIHQCGLLSKLSDTLMAEGIPVDILTETINTIAETIRGNHENQVYFQNVRAPSEPPKPALILLLMSMINEKQSLSLRCAAFYCFQSYLHRNPVGQREVMETLLPQTVPGGGGGGAGGHGGENLISAGQLLCGGLFCSDRLSNWFSAVALMHGLVVMGTSSLDHHHHHLNQQLQPQEVEEKLKVELLRVQLSTATSNTPVPLMQQLVSLVQKGGPAAAAAAPQGRGRGGRGVAPHQAGSNQVQTRVGLLMLLSAWLSRCPPAVAQFLEVGSVVPYLTAQVTSNEHDDQERLAQGLCALLLGICILYNNGNSSSSGQGFTEEQLLQLVERRIGMEAFLDRLGEVGKHEAYNRALKHPQPKCHEAKDLFLDHLFCSEFKVLEHQIIIKMNSRIKSSSGVQGLNHNEQQQDVVMRYKDLIRDQDQRISEISRANIYLQEELATAKQQLEEMRQTILTLQDQNSLYKAQVLQQQQQHQQQNGYHGVDHQPAVLDKRRLLEGDLEATDIVIVEEQRRQASKVAHNEVSTLMNGGDSPSPDYVNLSRQLQSLQSALAQKDVELESLRESSKDPLASQLESLRADQDALLALLSDQDNKLDDYRTKLRNLGADVSDDSDGDDDGDTAGEGASLLM